jgi:hypothetical protein
MVPLLPYVVAIAVIAIVTASVGEMRALFKITVAFQRQHFARTFPQDVENAEL